MHFASERRREGKEQVAPPVNPCFDSKQDPPPRIEVDDIIRLGFISGHGAAD